MNYGSIMYAAQSNTSQKPSSNNARCYKTTFSPPKKEVKQKSLSANVQKFLAKQEEEKRRKEIEARRKRDELLELRSHDKMSVKRVSTMLKRTKSANKSVMEDAIDNVNTVDTMAGPAQCDEDDYGYVSQEASSFYNKLMDKYSNMPPEEDKFSKSKKVAIKDLNAAKERVRAALNRVEEEEMMPRKRKRKSKGDNEEDDFVNDEIIYASKEESKEEPPKPKKIKRPAPPPMDFSQLLKIAEQKQYEPIVIEKKPEETEDDKPMTKKQRLEYLREKEARIQRERRQLEEKMRRKHPQSQTKRQSSPPPESSSRSQQKPSKPTGEPSIPRIPKLSQTNGSARIPKINQTDESSNVKSNKSSSEEQNLRIPKLSDRDKSSQKSKYVPPSVAEEILKKSGSVWSKPCNLSPSSSPISKSRHLDNRKDDKRKSISDSKSSVQQNLDRRKDVPNNKQPVKKPVTQSQTTSDFERKNEMMRQKMKEDMAIRKEMMKNSANRALNPNRKPNESSNRYESQNQKYKIDSNSNTSVKNGVNKNTIANKNPKLNGDSHSRSAPPKTKVLADLFGDNFPNDDETNDRNKSSKSQQNSSKSSTLLSSKERDDKFNNKSSSPSLSKNVSKQSPQNVNKSIMSKNISNNNNNTKQLSSSKKPMTSSSNGLKQRPQINDRPRPSDVRPRPSDVRPRQFPPADLKPKQFPPPDMRPRQFPPPDVRRNPMSRHSSQRRGGYEYDDEEEEEYDSELDDFIVDDDEVEEGVDVSKCIKEIFRYDKNRYRDADYDDDEVMESNYADVMKEEVKSTRIAIQEDLEEFLKEKAEKKRLQERKLQKLAEMKKKKRF